jgi:tRNA(Ile)-lysidine synthetase-like protein
MKNKPTIIDRVGDAIARDILVPSGAGVLVGVSGGPDSMALLDILRRLDSFPLRVAHLNHGLRPGDCDEDEALVRDYCRTWQIDLEVGFVDVARLAQLNTTGLEAAGRQARHTFFAECAQHWLQQTPSVRSVRIALAHHLDDQAETILLHLGRGCGLDGLTGMRPLFGNLIRPLLGIRRAEILDYLAAHQVPWRLDTTNEQLFTLRNRLRQQVLPIWREALGYDPATVLTRAAELVGDDQLLLDQLTEAAWLRVCLTDMVSGPFDQTIQSADLQSTDLTAILAGHHVPADRPVCFDSRAFRVEPAAIQNRLLRRAWRQASGQHRDIEWRHLRLARAFINEVNRHHGHLDWPQNIVIELDARIVRFFRR